jgi:hypothetical protein
MVIFFHFHHFFYVYLLVLYFKKKLLLLSFFFFFFFLAVLRLGLRASCLVGRHSTTWPTSTVLFCFSYFLDRVSYFCLGQASDCGSRTSLISWITSMWSKIMDHLVGWEGDTDPPDLCLLGSWNYSHKTSHWEFLPHLTVSVQLMNSCFIQCVIDITIFLPFTLYIGINYITFEKIQK